MANLLKPVSKSSQEIAAPETTSGKVSAHSPADPEVVAIARRRQFSPSEKRRILAAADRCSAPGEVGALLRREGIYSSHLGTWRKQRSAQERTGLSGPKRGRKACPAIAEAHRTAKLTRENERLRRQLAQAHLIIEVQKKVSSLLALQGPDEADEH